MNDTTGDDAFVALTSKISRDRGFGVANYKDTCMRRRIAVRMRARGAADYASYSRLLDSDPTLQRSIKLRNPYIDPMHLMQVDLLRRWRASQRQDQALFGALRATIGGISQGLQATG